MGNGLQSEPAELQMRLCWGNMFNQQIVPSLVIIVLVSCRIADIENSNNSKRLYLLSIVKVVH